MNRRTFLQRLMAAIPLIGAACSIYPEHHRKKPLCDPGQKDTKEKPCREWATCEHCGEPYGGAFLHEPVYIGPNTVGWCMSWRQGDHTKIGG